MSTRDELDEENDFEGMKCNVVLKWNEVTFRRYYAVLNDLEKSDSLLLKELFQTQIHPAHKRRAIEYNNKSLNEEQIEAVKGGIVDIVHLLHGPPGTGKTTTVC